MLIIYFVLKQRKYMCPKIPILFYKMILKRMQQKSVKNITCCKFAHAQTAQNLKLYGKIAKEAKLQRI